MNRMTVSQIVNLLLWKERDIQYGNSIPSWILQEGKRIHQRLGYDQAWTFRRYYQNDGEIWLIVGIPDKITKGVVEELKTFRTRAISPAVLQGAEIQAQLYCWLTGLTRWKIIGYSQYTNRASLKKEGEYDIEKVEKYLKGAIALKKKLAEMAAAYKELREKFWEG